MARVSSDRSSLLRNRIFKVLNKHKASPDNALKALSQCHAHINDRLLIEEIAKECGLKLSGFQTNEQLELYYDLKHGRQDLCFLSKGWDDPGFRLGEIVDIPIWKLADMREHVYALLKFCATQGVVMTIEETTRTACALPALQRVLASVRHWASSPVRRASSVAAAR